MSASSSITNTTDMSVTVRLNPYAVPFTSSSTPPKKKKLLRKKLRKRESATAEELRQNFHKLLDEVNADARLTVEHKREILQNWAKALKDKSDKLLVLICRCCGEQGYACDIRDDSNDNEYGLCGECEQYE